MTKPFGSKNEDGFDLDRYRTLLAEAGDEQKRLALINLMIEEGAKDRLKAHQLAERQAATAATIARVLGTSSKA